GAAGRAQAAALALEVGPAAHEARREVLQPRELDLQLAFGRARALREDLEDELRAVEDPAAAAERLLDVARLGGGELVVEHDEGRVQVLGRRADLGELAGAGVEARVGTASPAAHDAMPAHARARHQ